MNVELLNVDSVEYMKSIPTESIDLIITDPPYRILSSGCGGWGNKKYSMCDSNGYVFESTPELETYINEMYRILKNGTHCYIMTNNFNIRNFLNVIDNSKFKYIKNLIWHKMCACPTHEYMNVFEYIIMIRKGKERYVNNQSIKDLLSIKRVFDKQHINQKPVELMEILVTQSSNEGETVLDPFMGSGSTGIACVKNNRNFIGCEIDKKYFDIAKERIEEEQNKLRLDI